MTAYTPAVDPRREWRGWVGLALLFVALFYLPVGVPRFDDALHGALVLVRSYAREHVLLCLVPALFIAGAVATFLSDAAVLRYLGSGVRGWLKLRAYAVASVSGSVLAVCSCTVLPLFAGIHRRGAGLGPATAFLYSGPAINVLAISLTAGVLGWQLGLARAVGAVLFAVLIGLGMEWAFRHDPPEAPAAAALEGLPEDDGGRPLWRSAALLALLVAVLVFANWSGGTDGGWPAAVHAVKWPLTAGAGLLLALALVAWVGVAAWKVAAGTALTAAAALAFPAGPELPFSVAALAVAAGLASEPGEPAEWFESTWGFTRQIVPLLFAGVFVAGLLLGAPGGEGLLPSAWVERAVGGEGVVPTLFASLAGALMYFATLTEVPIVQGLLASGMGRGPALALLLAGPAVSLPNLLVIARLMGWRKTFVYVALVVALSTVAGVVYGSIL